MKTSLHNRWLFLLSAAILHLLVLWGVFVFVSSEPAVKPEVVAPTLTAEILPQLQSQQPVAIARPAPTPPPKPAPTPPPKKIQQTPLPSERAITAAKPPEPPAPAQTMVDKSAPLISAPSAPPAASSAPALIVAPRFDAAYL
ncbi:MAG: hypothetical protein ACXWIN_09025, partial [Burkholderiaceae bacterium]